MELEVSIFESLLEIKALQYLSSVNEDPNSVNTKQLVQEILNQLIDKKLYILKIDATGNIGIAIKSMLDNGLITNQQLQLIITLLSYFLLTKHINNALLDNHPLLNINRSQLLFGAQNLFHQLYKQIDPQTDNPFFNHSLPADYAISMTILNDIYPNREYNEYTKESYLNMYKLLSEKTNIEDYKRPHEWIEKTHEKLAKRINEMLLVLIPSIN